MISSDFMELNEEIVNRFLCNFFYIFVVVVFCCFFFNLGFDPQILLRSLSCVCKVPSTFNYVSNDTKYEEFGEVIHTKKVLYRCFRQKSL